MPTGSSCKKVCLGKRRGVHNQYGSLGARRHKRSGQRVRITGSGTNTNYTIAGVAQGMDSSFTDWGFAINGSLLPLYFPANPPSLPINGILDTTITAINENNVTLAGAPAVSLTVSVQHDNTPNVLAVCNSGLVGNLGSTIFFSQGASQGGVYVFNSPAAAGRLPRVHKIGDWHPSFLE